jgi:hypothetical protein
MERIYNLLFSKEIPSHRKRTIGMLTTILLGAVIIALMLRAGLFNEIIIKYP